MNTPPPISLQDIHARLIALEHLVRLLIRLNPNAADLRPAVQDDLEEIAQQLSQQGYAPQALEAVRRLGKNL
jgi:type VI protein secretion system component VasF